MKNVLALSVMHVSFRSQILRFVKPNHDVMIESPSIVAHIAAMKYVYKVPCYRQEAMWKLKGLPLTRQKMSKWLIDVFNNQLSPLYDLLLKELKRQLFLHVDETPYNTLASEKANIYYWVVTSGKFEEKTLPHLLTVTEDHPRRPRNCCAILMATPKLTAMQDIISLTGPDAWCAWLMFVAILSIL